MDATAAVAARADEAGVPIGDGWDSDVLVVDDRWIVKTPRRPAVAARLETEARLLRALAPLLPAPVPALALVRAANGGLRAVYRRLEGTPLRVPAARVAAELGAFLSALHGGPARACAEETGVEILDGPRWIAAFREKCDAFRAHVSPLLDAEERARAADLFAAFLSDERSAAFEPSLVHRDLGPEHILCGADGSLAGVLDWTDAQIGDPALDFAWLLHGLGDRFASGLVESYTRPLDATFRTRALFYHRLGPWYEVEYGLETGRADLVARGLEGVRGRLGR
jgi:aminoglycoside phosphotransferase (APT) family kinase protein